MANGSDRSIILEIGAKIGGFVTAMNQGQAAATNFTNQTVRGAAAAARALHKQREAAESLAKPLLAVGAVAALAVGGAIKAYADFDEKMSSVKSLSHATADEMRELKEAALTTGTAIGYSATQAAEAEIELVKAGTSAADITGGALSGALKLAAAGQIDVADATEIAASTLAQFGLKGKDVTHIADLLSAGADKALGGVSELGEGLKYIGPVAAAAHIGLEQTVGSLALLAQNGIMGEQAGTSLRGILLSLTAPSKVAAKAMQQYGIEVYNAQGKFIGFNGVAEQLNKKLGTRKDAERDAALGTIFGNAQITAATVLMKGGAKEVDRWTKAVNEQGFATEQAVGKMDNLNGDLTKLKASFLTAGIVTGQAADGPLRTAVQVITDLIDTYNEAPGAVQGVVLGVGALTAAVALSGGTMLIAIPKIVAFNAAMLTLATARIPLVSGAAALGLRSVSAFGRGMSGATVHTAGLSRASRIAVGASAGMGKALSATAGFLMGPWGIALGVGAAAVVGLNLAADSGAASQEELTNAISTTADAAKLLEKAGQRSDFSKFLAGDTAKNLQDLRTVIKQLSSEPVSIFSSFTIKQESKSLKDLGSALGEVASADAPSAARAFKSLRDEQKLTRDQTSKLIDLMPGYKAQLVNQATALGISASKSNLLKLATGQYEEAAKSAKAPTKDNADALQKLNTSAEDAAKAVESTTKALRDLTSPTLDARSAQRDFEAAVDAVTGSLKENGKSLDITTDKGRANQSALDAIAQSAEASAAAIFNQTTSQDQATDAMRRGRDELIAALGQYGITGQAAQDYADKIIGTPTDWSTLFTNNAPDAGGPVDQLRGKINAIPKLATTLFKVQGDSTAVDQILAKIRMARSEMKDLNGKSVSGGGRMGTFASGGQIVGPGTGTSDDVPIWASNREWIIRERSASKYGPQIMHAINQGTLSKQQLMSAMVGAPRFASGGPVSAPVRYAPPAQQVVVVQSGGGASGPSVTQNIYPQPMQSEREIGRMAMDELNWNGRRG
ncbi:phage tail tape measure protein [Curtobacterium sp. CFBP9011]|uniref:phage tail tape measure protein n=1 Tax=Curtobacterium sp. CFBP9011 TaxID=3096530 RepID=UPI002A6B72BD|nr:phage tail tape measure protein [Curtobacterium sp. CFBP9011]MDY1005749.1 phage tail tape measure protein [Curtobacterium sp. CFBP9011]